jgi:putative addiction module killer protein
LTGSGQAPLTPGQTVRDARRPVTARAAPADHLDAVAAARVATATYRLGQGNFLNTKGVGAGVFETRIDFGPGYRVHFGKDGDRVVILLGGSVKRDQQRAIERAKAAWAEYKARKRAASR